MTRTISLDLVKSGVRAVIKEIRHGDWKGFARRLYYMGIIPGSEVQVVVNNGHGPIIVKVKDIEISIGRGLAKRIFVEVQD